MLVLHLLISLLFNTHIYSTQILNIGGIFNLEEETDGLAFKYAVNLVNSHHVNNSLRLLDVKVLIDNKNVLSVSKATCALLQLGVVGIFGPNSYTSSPYVHSLCDNKEMPHVEINWDVKQSRSLVNLYPHPRTLSKVYVDVINEWKWRSFTILYENNLSLFKVGELMSLNNFGYEIKVRQLVIDSSWTYRSVLNVIKNSGDTHFVLDCEIDILEEFFKQAQQVGIVNEKYNFLITNLDMHTIDLAPYQYSGCNITGVQLINPEHSDMIKLSENIQTMKIKQGKKVDFFSQVEAWKIKTRTALLVDSVFLFYETLKDFKSKSLHEKPLFCNTTESWEHGYSIINSMKMKTVKGLSGMIKFDTNGVRSEFNLNIVELNPGGLTRIGSWNSTEGLNISRIPRYDDLRISDEENLQNKSFIVITALTPPYGMLRETTTKLTGNDRFEGFGIDLIHELSLMLGFNYTFVIQEDGSNGNYNRKTKQWNGMIREIIDERADLAITDLTITSERENAVDFTMPFMNLGISILYRKPEPVSPSLFTFASPFSLQVWMLLGVAYFFVSFSLFIIGRLCPSEWTNPYPCLEEPNFLINQFTLRNSLWFTIGSLMQQGTEIAPIGLSTRMVAGAWWFFTLIMVSSYTANLAAFLTVETLVTSFKNIDELANQNEIKYGAKSDGATSNFFRDSDINTYKNIWKYMYRHPEDMTSDNDEGVRRVKNENYAFLMESTTIEYIVERHCTLAQVGGLLDDKGYGIAMRKDSKYRNTLSAAVVKLQESGKITALKIKWWKEKRGGGNCMAKSAGGEATPLGLKNVEGVFLILLLGTIFGFIGTFIELGCHLLRKNYQNKDKFWKDYVKELMFAVKFKRKTKPIQLENSE